MGSGDMQKYVVSKAVKQATDEMQAVLRTAGLVPRMPRWVREDIARAIMEAVLQCGTEIPPRIKREEVFRIQQVEVKYSHGAPTHHAIHLQGYGYTDTIALHPAEYVLLHIHLPEIKKECTGKCQHKKS